MQRRKWDGRGVVNLTMNVEHAEQKSTIPCTEDCWRREETRWRGQTTTAHDVLKRMMTAECWRAARHCSRLRWITAVFKVSCPADNHFLYVPSLPTLFFPFSSLSLLSFPPLHTSSTDHFSHCQPSSLNPARDNTEAPSVRAKASLTAKCTRLNAC